MMTTLPRLAFAFLFLGSSLLVQGLRIGDEEISNASYAAGGGPADITKSIDVWCYHSIKVLEDARNFRKAAPDNPQEYKEALETVYEHIKALDDVQLHQVKLGQQTLPAMSVYVAVALNSMIKNFRTMGIHAYVRDIQSKKEKDPNMNCDMPKVSFIKHGQGDLIPLDFFKQNIMTGVEAKPDLNELLTGMGINLAEMMTLALDSAATTRTNPSYEALLNGAFLTYQQNKMEVSQVGTGLAAAQKEACPNGALDLDCVGRFATETIQDSILGPIASFFNWDASLLELDAADMTTLNVSGSSQALVMYKNGWYSPTDLKNKMYAAAESGKKFVVDSPKVQAFVSRNMKKGGLYAVGGVGAWIVFYLLPAILRVCAVVVAGAAIAVGAIAASIVAAPVWLAQCGQRLFGR